MKNIVAVAFFIAVISGCTKSSNSNTDYLQCKINGVSWSVGGHKTSGFLSTGHANGVEYHFTTPVISMDGSDSFKYVGLRFLFDTIPGVYPIYYDSMLKYPSSGGAVVFIKGYEYTTDLTHTGSVNVTSWNNGTLTGTFSFNAVDTIGNVVAITDGKFSITTK